MKKKIDNIKETTTKEAKKRRLFTCDIIELLNYKIKNKYFCCIIFLFIVFILILAGFLLNGDYSCVRKCPPCNRTGNLIQSFLTPFRLIIFIFLYSVPYLMSKHIFTFKIKYLHKVVNWIICQIICWIISFILIILFFYTADNINGNINLNLDKIYKKHFCTEDTTRKKTEIMCPAKPIIYLYPESKTEINVELKYPQKISHSYPKYENNWNVIVDTNSNITYNGRNYYGLYWEGKYPMDFKLDEGFVVKGSDSTTFLEEKLAILGLNEREANEFIIYWLPKLENNPYNFIKFASMEVQNEYMPLEINPKPDTLIRVMMAYKRLDNPIKVREQVLDPAPTRNGFVVIEWGGTEIGDNFVY